MNGLKQLVLALFATLACVSSYADAPRVEYVEKKTDFFYSSMYSYYSCDYAEDRAEEFVKALGGTNVSVRCSGGLPYSEFVSLRIKFTAAQATDAGNRYGTYVPVKILKREACDFNKRLLKEIADEFTIDNADFDGSCWDSRGDVRFTGNVLR